MEKHLKQKFYEDSILPYYNGIYYYALRLLKNKEIAEDVAQSTFEKEMCIRDRDWGPSIMASAAGTIGGIGSSVFNFVVGLVFSIYILYDKENLKKQATRLIRTWIPKRAADTVLHVAQVSNVTFRSFVTGQTTEAVILGTLCMIGMLILRIPFAPMIGALIGVTALIPIFGALIGMVVGAVMIVSVDPVKALIFIIFLLILQQIEGDIIYPRVVGSKMGLPGMWVLAAVTIGGSLGGAVGMLLGVPVFSVIYSLLNEATDKRELTLICRLYTSRCV